MGRIVTIGSINADYVYRVPHLPAPGETLAAHTVTRMLGGKGANQSIAAGLAGAEVTHIGAIGAGDAALLDPMRAAGVDLSGVGLGDVPTGHAIIMVDDAGENAIILHAGANYAIDETVALQALSAFSKPDICLLQNEVLISAEMAKAAKAQGLTVIYSAAPFDMEAVGDVLAFADLLVMNEGEAAQMTAALGQSPDALGVDVLITKGASGATYHGADRIDCPAFQVTPVDTTGAGDCYIGSFAAARARGVPIADAMRWAAAASALQVTRPGTTDAMPKRDEVDAFLAARS